MAALVAAHLSDRRRSLLAWGVAARPLVGLHRLDLPLGRRRALARRSQNYPPALKEAFGIGELTNVEQYLHAEMLSLIVPLALGYLAVRAVASGLSGAAESGRLDVLLSAPVSRRRLGAAELRRDAPSSWPRCWSLTVAAHRPRQPPLRRRPLLRRGRRRLRQRLAPGAALRRPRRRRHRLLAAHQRRHRRGRRRAGVDVRDRPDRPPRPRPLRHPLRLGLQVLRQRDRRRDRTARPSSASPLAAVALAALGAWLFDRRDLAG